MKNLKTSIYIKKLDNFPREIEEIKYATENSSGIDLIAAINEAKILKPMERTLIPTGISIAFNDQDLEAQIRSRSGLAYKNGIIVLNSPGTVDNDYRGEIKVILINLGDQEFKIEPNMRIAQMVISKYAQAELNFVDDFEEKFETERGEGGFGSTGLQSEEK